MRIVVVGACAVVTTCVALFGYCKEDAPNNGEATGVVPVAAGAGGYGRMGGNTSVPVEGGYGITCNYGMPGQLGRKPRANWHALRIINVKDVDAAAAVVRDVFKDAAPLTGTYGSALFVRVEKTFADQVDEVLNVIRREETKPPFN